MPKYLLPLLLIVAACSQPTTQLPTFSAAELQKERATQESYAQGSSNVKVDGVEFTSAQNAKFGQRLERLVNKVAPHATTLCYDMHGQNHTLCNMDVVLQSKTKTINAFADGKRIVIEPHMVEFAKNDTHLAMVLAHEYAHHMMGHVQATKQNVMGGSLLGTLGDALLSSQGISTQGALGKLGAQSALLSYSPAFEHEADYIAMYILARANYNLKEAPQFWREMTRQNPRGIYTRTTHPTGPERYVVLNKTIDEINAKKQSGQPILPNRKPKS